MDRHVAKRTNPVDALVGSRVRLRRMSLGMSQTALAERVGVTFQQIQKYEKGTNRIGASRLQAIAQALQVALGFFFENSTVVSGDIEQTDAYLTSEGIRLNRAFLQIDDPLMRRRVIELVRSIADIRGDSD